MSGEEFKSAEFKSPHATRRKRRRFIFWLRLVLWGSVALLLALILYFAASILFRRTCGGYDRAKAHNNARMVGYALYNFENDFGCYPNDETPKNLDEGSILSSAGGSNYYFSQLIAGGYVDQEAPFYAPTTYTIEPDNAKYTAEEILKRGEVGFTYVLWGPSMNSTNLRPDAPLLFAMLEKGEKKAKSVGLFERRKYFLIVLRVDMTVVEYKAERDGTFMLNGKDYFDWSQPHWGGQKPKIVWPE